MGMDVYLTMGGPSEFTVTGALRDYDRVDRLREIRLPALFVCGEHDEATPAATDAYHRALPGSELAVIAGASHLPWCERPAEFFAVLRGFLRRAERRRRRASCGR
jgi:proline iminopeptidase